VLARIFAVYLHPAKIDALAFPGGSPIFISLVFRYLAYTLAGGVIDIVSRLWRAVVSALPRHRLELVFEVPSHHLQVRLTQLKTQKAGGELLQDLYYTYDPVGNITQIEDRGRPTVFEPSHENP
jgi:hypothetical protein